jgi:site-specific DNA recombinase
MRRLDQYDVILIWAVHRLVRRTVELIRVMDTCKAHNVVIITENGPLDWFSSHGEFTTTMWAGLAQMESANISNRVKAAYEAIAQIGRWKGGTPPFGWQAAPHESGRGQRLELNPTEAEIVHEAIDRVLSGESVRSICGDFTKRQIQTRRKDGQTGDYSTRWYGTTLRKLLRSPLLIGQHLAGGTKEVDSSGRLIRVHAPHVVTDDRGIPIQPHESLVDLHTYQRLQAELDNRRQQGRRRPNSTLLTGLVFCGKCGSRMAGRSSDDPKAFFGCSARTQFGDARCSGNTVNRHYLEQYVIARLFQKLTPDRVAAARAALAAQKAGAPNRSATESKRAQIEQALAILEEDRRQGLYSSPTAGARFRTQYAGLIEQLDQLAEPTEEEAPAPDFSMLDGRPVEEVWESLDNLSDRARLLRQAIDRIEVKAGRRGAPRGSNRGARFDTGRVAIHWSTVLGG